jgi:Adenylosuccinate lyase
MWLYISRGVISQKKIKGEVGSSTMPHKINPIQFENAEGNLGISSTLLNHMIQKLPVSRMQRDLTDSTVLRNQGVALGYSLISIKSISKGVSRITLNKKKTEFELNEHWEVLGEAIQTILRKEGKEDAYEKLKNLTRGETVDRVSLKLFIENLRLTQPHEEKLLSLSPKKYIGLAPKIANRI